MKINKRLRGTFADRPLDSCVTQEEDTSILLCGHVMEGKCFKTTICF